MSERVADCAVLVDANNDLIDEVQFAQQLSSFVDGHEGLPLFERGLLVVVHNDNESRAQILRPLRVLYVTDVQGVKIARDAHSLFVDSAKVVLKSHDVIFFEVVTDLRLYKNEIAAPDIFDSVLGFDRNETIIVRRFPQLGTLHRDNRFATHDYPVLVAMMVQLQGNAMPGLDCYFFHATIERLLRI